MSKTTKSSMELKLSQKLSDLKTLKLWNDRLGHLGSTMLMKIVDNSFERSLENHQLTISSGYLCILCSQGKLITRPSFAKVACESLSFMQKDTR